jgi:hypothetical protein
MSSTQSSPSTAIAPSPAARAASPNATVVIGTAAAIIDANGNKWTISTGAQVAINGIADTTTAGVIELAYVNGTIWQENNSQLWWGETLPNAAWSPLAGTSVSPLPATPPTPAPAASANNTVVKGTTTAITDAGGNKWSITGGGQVAVNGIADATTGNVIELAYVSGTIWQENASNLWWGETQPNAAWAPVAGTSVSPLPTQAPPPSGTIGSGSDTIVLTMSDDPDGPAGAAGRDAEFTLNVDGQQIGGLQTVTASRAAGQTETFTFQGNFAPGAHKITVTFANNSMTGGDKAAFNDGGDRNLYVNTVAYDGATVSSTITGIYESPFFPPLSTDGVHPGNAVFSIADTTAIPANAPSTPTTTPSAVSVGTGADTLTLAMSEDPFQGDAQFSVTVDGTQTGGTLTTSAVEFLGQTQQFLLHGSWGNGPHTVAIAFLNDAIGPPDARGLYDSVDRNLIINAVSYDGTVVSSSPWGLFNNGSHGYNVPATSATPPIPVAASPNDTMVLAGATAAITDASGNKWTITGTGQVAVNGVADSTTANVTELAYVNTAVWQENASSLWWDKTSPTAAWGPSAGTSTSPLPAPVIIASGTTGATVSQSQVSVVATAGNHMLFISGSGDVVNLSGGANGITDTGHGNTYIVPAAGHGTDSFTSNILATTDVLDLKPALAATDWNGAAATLSNFLTVADSAQGATLSTAATSGGTGVAIASISGATTATLTSLLAHSIT